MKKKLTVILRDTVPHVGQKDEVREVSMGFFRNYLRPRGLAIIATLAEQERVKIKQARAVDEKTERIAEAKQEVQQTKETTLTFTKRAAKQEGHIFGSVTAKQIEEALKEQGIEHAQAKLSKPIREIGEHEISVDFGNDITGKVKVVIKAE